VVLYLIAKDIRVSDRVVSLSTGGTGVLALRTYDFTRGNDINLVPNLFDAVNVGTIAYTYHPENGGYIERVYTKPNNLGTDRKKLLAHIVRPCAVTNVATPEADSMFYWYPVTNPVQPYSGVTMNF